MVTIVAMCRFVIFTLAFCLILLGVQSVQASGMVGAQYVEFNHLKSDIEFYHTRFRKYPVTDSQSTWFEKLVKTNTTSFFRVSSDGRYPLDRYGNFYFYEEPSATNGNQIVLRTIGENGIDDGGALDDWDIRYGPNYGYWGTHNWPAAHRRAAACALLLLLGIGLIQWKINSGWMKLVAAMIWFGFLAAVVMPWGFDTSFWGISTGSRDPRWIIPISFVGLLAFPVAIFVGVFGIWYRFMIRRKQLLPGIVPCNKCGYDLRGTITASIDRCPECGEPVGDDRA